MYRILTSQKSEACSPSASLPPTFWRSPIPGPLLLRDELFEGEGGGLVAGISLNRDHVRIATGAGNANATYLTGHRASLPDLRLLFALR